MAICALAAAGTLVLTAPRWADSTGWGLDALSAPLAASDCVVSTTTGEVGLTQDQAQRVTTALAGGDRAVAGVDAAVVDALLGVGSSEPAPVLTCQVEPADGLPVQELTGTGLTPRAQRVLDSVQDAFGEQSLGGFAPGGVDTGHGAESTHYEGRAIDLFFRPVGAANRRDGWLLAHWLVAHAQELDIQYVIWDDRYWGVHRSERGWRDYEAPPPATAVLRHLDHVHVDVLRGG